MYGRYGSDQLNLALLGLYLVLYLLSSLPRLSILSWVALGCLAFATFRLFSKNLTKRRAENAKFLELVRPIARKIGRASCRERV